MHTSLLEYSLCWSHNLLEKKDTWAQFSDAKCPQFRRASCSTSNSHSFPLSIQLHTHSWILSWKERYFVVLQCWVCKRDWTCEKIRRASPSRCTMKYARIAQHLEPSYITCCIRGKMPLQLKTMRDTQITKRGMTQKEAEKKMKHRKDDKKSKSKLQKHTWKKSCDAMLARAMHAVCYCFYPSFCAREKDAHWSIDTLSQFSMATANKTLALFFPSPKCRNFQRRRKRGCCWDNVQEGSPLHFWNATFIVFAHRSLKKKYVLGRNR